MNRHKLRLAFYVRFLSIALTILLLSQSVAWGHGGVSVEDDLCVMRIGSYRAHFTGYQPEKRATQEFCEDIPIVGHAIFVLDFMSDELRNMEVDFRIIKDVNEIGNTATLADLGTQQDIEAATIFYAPPKRYPTGTISLDFSFTEEGRYIGIVTATSPDAGAIPPSVFPFAVGLFPISRFIVPVVVILVLAGGLFAFLMSRAMRRS